MGPENLKPLVLIADEEPVYRAGLAVALPDYKTYEYGVGASSTLVLPKTDLAIVGKSPPGFDALDFIAGLTRKRRIPVIVIMGEQNDKYLHDAVNLGAQGFIQRIDTLERVAEAVESVLKKIDYVSPTLASRVISIARYSSEIYNPNLRLNLSSRHRQVWGLVADGKSNQAIADTLILSPYTVKTYISDLFKKFGSELEPGSRKRVGLTKLAIARGIIPNPDPSKK